MTLSDTTKGALVWAVMFLLGGAAGWFLKGERTVIQVQKVMVKENKLGTAAEDKYAKQKAIDQAVLAAIRARDAAAPTGSGARECGDPEALWRLRDGREGGPGACPSVRPASASGERDAGR